MNTMTGHIFPTNANFDQRQYIQRYIRKQPEMKVNTFIFLQLNNYLGYLPPDCSGQPVAPLFQDKVKEIIYQEMPTL